ncbi:putative 115 kDa protein in type-1 like protein [Argiope bruennichi]|uniref:Putative 115 kDa protein in type-1 like protein n=1 Tax=Argiope bruennichi TaxID=94029 RepID=A0A8T0F1R2_ARGBR|nr:putative 115 kDa protein in type-1 like protein [Argiope bruennichi]
MQDQQTNHGHNFISSKGLKIIQINLGRAKAATDNLHPMAAKLQPDIIAIQEPYQNNDRIKGIPSSWSLFCSTSRKAAIAIPKPTIKIAIIAIKINTIAIKIQTTPQPTTIISAYSSPASNIQETLQELQEIINTLPREQIIITGDLNGYNNLWGYEQYDLRGNQILDFALGCSLYINKQDAPPIFSHCGKRGWPDLTLYSQNLIDTISKWEVLEEPKMLNHLLPHVIKTQQAINKSNTPQQLNETTIILQDKITTACKNSYKIKKPQIHQPNWYTSELEIQKKNRLKALRRRAQRSGENRPAQFLLLKRETAIYMKNVRQARNLGWKGFCSQAKNPYGKHYKAAFRNSVTPAQLILLKEKEATGGQLQIAAGILDESFPHPVSTPKQATSVNYSPDDCPFSPQEVARTINGLPKGKAPNLDGIDNIVIQQINQKFPQLFTDFFNKCLTLKKFPDSLKIGNILFRKPGKPINEATSYRPISLLPTIGKVLEKLLTQRLPTT